MFNHLLADGAQNLLRSEQHPFLDDEGGASAGFENGKGTLGNVTAYGIEQGVAIGHQLGEILGVVIDDFVGTKVK